MRRDELSWAHLTCISTHATHALSSPLEPPHPHQIIRDRETHEPKGFGFVTFSLDNPQSAQTAMQRLNGATLQGPFGGRTIRVSPSNKTRGPGEAGGAQMAAAR